MCIRDSRDFSAQGQDVYLEEIKKAIEDRKNAEIQTIIEKMTEAEKHAIELIKQEEANKITTLQKKVQSLEKKIEKKDSEIEQLKSMTKLKQTNFVETIQSLSKEFAEKNVDANQTILIQQDKILQLEKKLHQETERNVKKNNNTGCLNKKHPIRKMSVMLR